MKLIQKNKGGIFLLGNKFPCGDFFPSFFMCFIAEILIFRGKRYLFFWHGFCFFNKVSDNL